MVRPAGQPVAAARAPGGPPTAVAAAARPGWWPGCRPATRAARPGRPRAAPADGRPICAPSNGARRLGVSRGLRRRRPPPRRSPAQRRTPPDADSRLLAGMAGQRVITAGGARSGSSCPLRRARSLPARVAECAWRVGGGHCERWCDLGSSPALGPLILGVRASRPRFGRRDPDHADEAAGVHRRADVRTARLPRRVRRSTSGRRTEYVS